MYSSDFSPIKDQSSFYKVPSLAISIMIKAFNWLKGNSLTFLKHFWDIWDFILSLTEDDSALKVAQQIKFQGPVTYKPVVYKKSVLSKFVELWH